jgi:hypothetical protein
VSRTFSLATAIESARKADLSRRVSSIPTIAALASTEDTDDNFESKSTLHCIALHCIAWDGSLFIGEFQYRRCCPTELEIVDLQKMPKLELAKLMHLTDFEAENPEILATFTSEPLSQSGSDSLRPTPLSESESLDEEAEMRTKEEESESESENRDSDSHSTEEIESSISSDPAVGKTNISDQIRPDQRYGQ